MIATLAMSPSTDFRDSNTAGAPLPLLPRRSPSATRGTFPFPSTTPQKTSPPIKLVVQHPTPPDDHPAEGSSSSSSSSSSDGRPTLTIRPKRRGVRSLDQGTPTPTPVPTRRQPPPQPTPIQTRADADAGDATPRHPLVYSPGTGIGLRALSTSHIPVSPSPSPPKQTTDEASRIIRKKSGQPVKSSLKSSTPRVRGSLAVVIGSGNSRSAPSTPTTRPSVHFDAQLEHVKLFLAEQKPLAVSRDGSPTDDTSGTDGDFPNWIFGGSSEEQGQLEMHVHVPPPLQELDVKLQALSLGDDGSSVTGTVAVRNISFDKWVAVRFTFDEWQTTSEVTARYSHSLPGGKVDVFSFSIRLNDLLARIEGKVMILAVRYSSAGREMWDNNGGGNYRATFKRVRKETKKDQREETKANTRANINLTANSKSPEGEVAADLRSRLERVVNTQEDHPRPIQRRTAAKNAAEVADKFKAGGSLAARYDFGTSSRNPWRPHQRAASYPALSPTSPPLPMVPWPKQLKTKPVLGSPRDAYEDTGEFRPAPYITSDSEDVPFSVPVPPPATQRHHQRGYFDIPRDVAGMRRTPPGTPRSPFRALDDLTPLSSPARFNSFPPLDPRIRMVDLEGRLTPREAAQEGSASEGSTPSFVSSEPSSRSGTVSPVSPPDYVGLGLASPVGEGPTMYHSFLDKFCFYTGPEVDGLPRTQSASSVEEFLSGSAPRLLQKQSLHFDESCNSDSSHGSGSTTPTTTKASPTRAESRAATLIAA
ncbi:putative phosphatase regulatory subunit-domain-containing protein [Mycena sanguinolenta]|nr:putative phosphatase regulatory subunit-domain-containing protein [Mycena sanguinolenta]